MPKKTVLVLGAGASCGYGYPSGRKLGEDILKLSVDELSSAQRSGIIARPEAFLEDFRNARVRSIDRFVASRPDYAGIAKAAIASVLLDCEDWNNLYMAAMDDDWYAYLVDKLLPDEWEKFDPSWLPIITFNYDRSLEFVLWRAICAVYKKSESEAIDRLQMLPIIHIYGDLTMPWAGNNHLPYGVLRGVRHWDRTTAIRVAAANLHLINETRDDGGRLAKAQAALEAAEQVCFLGFSFDRTNVQRLGAPQTFVRWEFGIAAVAATTLHMHPSEVRQASRRLFQGAEFSVGAVLDAGQAASRLKDNQMRCEELLRSGLFLEDGA